MHSKLTPVFDLEVFLDNKQQETFGLNLNLNTKRFCLLANTGIFNSKKTFHNFIKQQYQNFYWLPPLSSFFKTHNYQETLKALFARTCVSMVQFLDSSPNKENSFFSVNKNFLFDNNAVFRISDLKNPFKPIFETQNICFHTCLDPTFDLYKAQLGLQRINFLTTFGIERSNFWDTDFCKDFLKPYRQILEEFDDYNKDCLNFLTKQSTIKEISFQMFLENTLTMNTVNVVGNIISKDNVVCAFKKNTTTNSKEVVVPIINQTSLEQFQTNNSLVVVLDSLAEAFTSKLDAESYKKMTELKQEMVEKFFHFKLGPNCFPPWFFLTNSLIRGGNSEAHPNGWKSTGIVFNFDEANETTNKCSITLTAMLKVDWNFKKFKKMFIKNLEKNKTFYKNVEMIGLCCFETKTSSKPLFKKDCFLLDFHNLAHFSFNIENEMVETLYSALKTEGHKK